MLKRAKLSDPTTTGQGFVVIHFILKRLTECITAPPTEADRSGIKKKSRVPGVMITQFVQEIPEGKSCPDFLRKPISLTIQEGKLGMFKAVVTGDPQPKVTWNRARGEITEGDKFKSKYDDTSGENALEIRKVSPAEADTYKCFAENEYGRAICTATLNVIEVGFRKEKAMQQMDISTTDPALFRKMLKKGKEVKPQPKDENEIDERFWEIIMSADRKDYERICQEYGVKDLRLILKKLDQKKEEREEEQSKYVDYVKNLRHVQVRGDGSASFQLEFELKDPTSRIFLYKDGVMVPFFEDADKKHNLKIVGKKLVFSINDLLPEDAGLYQVDVEDVNLFSTEFKIPNLSFVVKIQEVKAQEREDAIFECVLSHPMPRIRWTGKNLPLEDGERYCISASEDKLVHTLLIRDVRQLDKGIYAAFAGVKSCSAWLIVQADAEAASGGKKAARKTTSAGGAGLDLGRVAEEQRLKLQEEKERMEAALKAQREAERQEALRREAERLELTKREEELQCKSREEELERKSREEELQRKSREEELQRKKREAELERKRRAEELQRKKRASEEERKKREEELERKRREEELERKKREDAKAGGLKAEAYGSGEDGPNASDASAPASKQTDADKSGKDSSLNSKDVKHRPLDREADSKVPGESTAGKDVCGRESSAVCSETHTEKCAALPDSNNNCMIIPSSTSVKLMDLKSDKMMQDSNTGEVSDGNDENSQDTSNMQALPSVVQQSKVDGCDPDQKPLSGSEGEEVSCESADSSGPERQSQAALSDKADQSIESENNETEDAAATAKRKRQGPLLEDSIIDPGVQFVSGLSDVDAILGATAEMVCKVSSEDCEGFWFKDNKKLQLSEDDDLQITKDGSTHKLIISHCKEKHSGKYRFEADGRKTEAVVYVKDPPRFSEEDLSVFSRPVVIKLGQSAVFQLPFQGQEPVKMQWFREDEELVEDQGVRIERSHAHSRLLLSRCQRKDAGEIKFRLRNDHGSTEVTTQLVVLDKPTLPQGPVDLVDSSPAAVQFKWRPPKDDGGCPVHCYTLERRQVGRNTWKKVAEVRGEPEYRDTDVEHGRKYCYRIRAVNAEGASDAMETDDLQAGTLAFPGPPSTPRVVSASKDCITLSWGAPSSTAGSRLLGYSLEKRKKGSNLWSLAGDLIKEKTYAVKDVAEGMEYEFRVAAINLSGAGEFSSPSDFVFARDPKKPPGRVTDLKVTDRSYTHLSLSWTKPGCVEGLQGEPQGYHVEIRPADSSEWSRCNATPSLLPSYSVKGLRSMEMYWVRVMASNEGGESPPVELPDFVLAMPLPVRPRFTDLKMKSFLVVRAGNSVRITVNFEASPPPQVCWLKDNAPVAKRVTVSNCDGSSQLLIPSSERSDSGIYSVTLRNLVGQETFSMEVRVTDDPKPPGPVTLEETVPGTVTVSWEPSPDEKRDDRLHYAVCQLDSTKRTWSSAADRLFNNRLTVCNIMAGRQYHFWVYAKNDMGTSEPSVSPTWGTERKRERFVVSAPPRRVSDRRCAPAFLVPLKCHSAPRGYECYMSCAVKGDPRPRVTWCRNGASLHTNTNYHVWETCGVCSMLILRVAPQDVGQYSVVAENALGRAECSATLSVTE